MLNPRCCHINHFNIVAAIDFLLPSNISLTVAAFEPSSTMNFEGLKQDKTKYGRDRFTVLVLQNFDPSRFKFQAVLWFILFKPLVRDPKLRCENTCDWSKKWCFIGAVNFLACFHLFLLWLKAVTSLVSGLHPLVSLSFLLQIVYCKWSKRDQVIEFRKLLLSIRQKAVNW